MGPEQNWPWIGERDGRVPVFQWEWGHIAPTCLCKE